MSPQRDDILARIDRASPVQPAADIAAAAAALIASPDTYRPGFAKQSNYDRFVAKATSESVTATVQDLKNLADLPKAVAAYLTAKDLPKRVALQPRQALSALNWASIDTHNTPAPDEPVAITLADLGVAETGSVVFLTAADAPVLMNFLGLHHLVVLRKNQIFRHLEDVFAQVGKLPADQPRSINVITGTSGTADIEAKNVRGAHGPRYMHIFCLEEDEVG